MVGIQCRNHPSYNGAKDPYEFCTACWQIRALRILVDNLPTPSIRVIQPIKLVTNPLPEMSTEALLEEIKSRIEYDGG